MFRGLRRGGRLYRSRRRMIAGVAAGIGDYLGIDPTVVRVLWVVLSILVPPALIIDVVLYVVLVLVIPTEPPEIVV